MKKIEGEPVVEVGVLWGPRVVFTLHGAYRLTAMGPEGEADEQLASGMQVVSREAMEPAALQANLRWQGRPYRSLLFIPTDPPACTIELHAVTIGLGFHWQRQENQTFAGCLKFVADDEGQVVAINLIPLEDYLVSVISSEMSAHASPELLRAHAVVSRSWLLAQMGYAEPPAPSRQAPADGPDRAGHGDRENPIDDAQKGLGSKSLVQSLPDAPAVEEVVRWYDHQSHTLFHVCADDHCQRYQGLTRPITLRARQAVASTRGQVLTYDGNLCDTRFSKCCGGMLEEFPYCWDDVHHPYLTRRRDWLDPAPASCCAPVDSPDLRQEVEAERWIRSAPEAFCCTADPAILRQVLNDYDQETRDFYRWQVDYTQQELADLIRNRSGFDLGQIVDLIPLVRGTSGRISRLKIVGTKRSLIIGKELEIRRTLSPSHLYSSAFVVQKQVSGPSPVPTHFRLIGAGWGHGVGLCQIGAAVMGARGYSYRDILLHYYVGAQIESVYA